MHMNSQGKANNTIYNVAQKAVIDKGILYGYNGSYEDRTMHNVYG